MTEFDLSPEIVDQLMYAMENQNELYFFDTATQTLVSGPSGDEEMEEDADRYLGIPVWNSSDGFMLMEKFTGTLRNPLIRENLREILSGGRGVFRNFKHELKKHAELERLWFNFKEREMKNRIARWYNDLRELWGLERIGIEVDETDELIISDFEISEGSCGFDSLIAELDRKAYEEIFAGYPRKLADYFYAKNRKDGCPLPLPFFFFTARTPGGELAGFIWFRQIDLEPVPEDALQRPSLVFDLLQIYVLPEYRGLGLASLLLDKTADFAFSREADWLFLDLFVQNKGLADCLLSRGFEPSGTVFRLPVRSWGDT
ncbi:MAG: GNAT family N-acetyltransferase [Spirochaetales bacterium]|nr:GNAT family N-acetyltransferase [Spirochaetales bacterium]